ncbi:MFS transporter [Deinococcus sp.]|uniref:MFS transporter n=1 Tax=Deinococcus sp. TaxID=47478 RepID=UPI003CC6D0AF
MKKLTDGRLYYGWVVVIVTALALLIAAGARSAPGVFLLPMQKDLELSRATLSGAVSLGLVMFGLGAPLSGFFIDRYGPRRVVLAGLGVLGASFIASASVRGVPGLYAWWGLLSGLGTGVVGGVLGATVANRWFVRRRGLVTGLFGAATSAGQLMFIPLLTALAGSLGWRTSSSIIGGLGLALLLPVLLLLRDTPAELGLLPDGDAQTHAPVTPRPTPGIMAAALRSRDFWLLCATFFVCGFTSNGIIGTHFIAYCGENGLTATYAAGMLALMGGFNFVGTLASGYFTDRIDPRGLLSIYYAFRGLSLMALPLIPPGPALVFFAVLFGLDYIATVPPTTALVADRFGRANLGTVYGWVFCAHQVGAALAAWLGGVLRESLGTYGPSFIAAGVLAVAAALLSRAISRPALKTAAS